MRAAIHHGPSRLGYFYSSQDGKGHGWYDCPRGGLNTASQMFLIFIAKIYSIFFFPPFFIDSFLQMIFCISRYANRQYNFNILIIMIL